MNTIKKLIFPLIFIITIASCKSNSKDESRNIQLLSDSTVYHNSTNTDSIKGNQVNKELDTYRYHSKEATNRSSESHSNAVVETKSAEKTTSSSSANSAATKQTSSSSTKQTKKGWSKAAQGAAIGGAAGAVGGAIISKHKGTGAAIGAAVGAASGYIIGKDREKKDKK